MTEHDLPLLRPLPPELIRTDGAANEPAAIELAPLELPGDGPAPLPSSIPPEIARIPLGASMPDLRDIPVLHASSAPQEIHTLGLADAPALAELPAAAQAAPLSAAVAVPRRSSLAGGMHFSGRIRLTGLFTLGGTVEGPITATSQPGEASHVTVSSTGVVQGDISARNITVQGRTTGLLDAPGGRVSLHEGAVVQGRIRYGTLQVSGADLNAQLERVRPDGNAPA